LLKPAGFEGGKAQRDVELGRAGLASSSIGAAR
jgi:hypothetical protein